MKTQPFQSALCTLRTSNSVVAEIQWVQVKLKRNKKDQIPQILCIACYIYLNKEGLDILWLALSVTLWHNNRAIDSNSYSLECPF